MKLGEALTLRARQATVLNDLLTRIRQCVVVQEGDNPPEEPWTLIDEYLALSGDHATLVTRIMQTNLGTIVDGSNRLVDLLAEREMLIRERNLYQVVAQTAVATHRYGRQEIKYVAQVNVGEVRQKHRDVSREVTELDVRIQAINWQTELEE